MSAPWATLTPYGEDASAKLQDVHISKDEFVIGRSKTSDYLLQGKKMISGRHFVIRRRGGGGGGGGGDDDDGDEDVEATLEDCSTNGTMLNNSELVKQKSVTLKDGEFFSFPTGYR